MPSHEVSIDDNLFEGILGRGNEMRKVFNFISKVSKSKVPVLILGESGSGKEMVAKAIHCRSGARAEPFIPINCSAIPENLIESELFGHEKGSFTGANCQRVGLIETATGGTLFLDEIGDLPLPMQVKLLRFLQEWKITRVGGRKEIPVSTRVISATHIDLIAALQSGRFREDLYFRLAVVVCRLPPLRERGDDILLLADFFLEQYIKQYNRNNLNFSMEAVSAISRHSWVGNVRELQNRIQRAVIMADGTSITEVDLELKLLEEPVNLLQANSDVDTNSIKFGLKQAKERLEKDMIDQSIIRNNGNISAAARDLGISRPTFYELMNKFGVKP